MTGFLNMFQGVKGKLLIVMIIPLLAITIICLLAFYRFNMLGSRLDFVYKTQLPNSQRLGTMSTSRSQLGYHFWAAIGNQGSPERRAETIPKIEQAINLYTEAQKAYDDIPFEPQEEKNYATISKEREEFFKLTHEMIDQLKNGHDDLVKKQLTDGRWHEMALHIKEGIDLNLKFFADQAIESNRIQTENRRDATMTMSAVGGAAVLVIILLVLGISRSLTRSISEVSGVLSQTVTQVSAAIQQLSLAGSTLSSSTSTSASSLQETVASVEELSSTVKHNSSNAKQASELSETSKSSAQNGEKEIRHLIESMKDISQSSRKIEEIINVIDDIAFQTNLLALNAAVEAARAGDQGRGFAVVAEAVRALAQRSASAAKDISGMIKDSVHKIESGVKIADQSGEVLVEIVASVNQVSDLNREISVASQEQTNGIVQISQAMNNLDRSVQTNAASAEEIASTSTEIASQSEQMTSVMEKLNEVIFGRNGKSTAVTNQPNVVPFTQRSESKRQKAEAMIPFGEADSSQQRKISKLENF